MNVAVRFNKLRKANSIESYQLYKAALGYDLIEPIIINSREDLKSERIWKNRFDPYMHQVDNLITFCKRLPVNLLADDVGLGKTISAGLIMSELESRNKAHRFLVVCPKLLIYQWEEELNSKFNLKCLPLIGAELSRIIFPNNPCVVITTYNSARLYFDDLAKSGFDMLILDEAHKLRNLYGTIKPPKVALKFQEALISRMFKYVIMLTATPIQNRLWDIYSLIDLLTSARGHKNPFGRDYDFSLKFLGGNISNAHYLRKSEIAEFRSIVYSYMSRIRKQDVDLLFPNRKVYLQHVKPLSKELELMKIVAKNITKINRLSQISLLQALVSSPHALYSQVKNMAQNRTVPLKLLSEVEEIVPNIEMTSKLKGLLKLIEEIRNKNQKDFRIVVFTHRQITQGVIKKFIESKDIKCGIINGSSGPYNKDTLQKFRKDPPDINVIISTEAGSEGINLQAANIVVNYDLPWNPMIVEQRIGRVQRLASKHANVLVYNIVLKDTFEDEILGKLMTKLNMISSAIGEVESVLQGAGFDDEETGRISFEEAIRRLVIQALEGKDTTKETLLIEKNITYAKEKLTKEEKDMDELFGSQKDVKKNIEPLSPNLKRSKPEIPPKEFILRSLKELGATISETSSCYKYELDNNTWLMSFEEGKNDFAMHTPGTKNFENIVNKMIITPMHLVEHDYNEDIVEIKDRYDEKIKKWFQNSDAELKNTEISISKKSFEGNALVRMRITTAHDSYERLINVKCLKNDHIVETGNSIYNAETNIIEDPEKIGINIEKIIENAMKDKNIKAFCKYYTDRLKNEFQAVQGNARMLKKLEDDLTPRIETEIVGIDGKVIQNPTLTAFFKIDGKQYEHIFKIIANHAIKIPPMQQCDYSLKNVPPSILDKCDISGKKVIKHYLLNSDISKRKATPENFVICAQSKKNILRNEAIISDLTGDTIAIINSKKSDISGKIGENNFFSKCKFSNKNCLNEELSISEISGKKYAIDDQAISVVSGLKGHNSEFIFCEETNKPLLKSEASICSVSKKKVVPNVLLTSAYSGKKALQKYIVYSSISKLPLIKKENIESSSGDFCSKDETIKCAWSSIDSHPNDIEKCNLTNLPIRSEFLNEKSELIDLSKQLHMRNYMDAKSVNALSEQKILSTVKPLLEYKNIEIVSCSSSPDKKIIAVVIVISLFLGFVKKRGGFLYSRKEKQPIGNISIGKMTSNEWILEKTIST